MRYSIWFITFVALNVTFLSGCATLLPEQQSDRFPNRTYVRKIVGEACPNIAKEIVSSGWATSYFADRYVGQGKKSFIDKNFTFCKVIFEYDGPQIMFNKNFAEENEADERARTAAIHGIVTRRCHEHGGDLQSRSYQTRHAQNHLAWFCMRDGLVLFMYYQGKNPETDLHNFSIASPNSANVAEDVGYVNFLRIYGYQTVEDELYAAQRKSERAVQAKQQRDAARARLSIERPRKMEVGSVLCKDQNGGVFRGFVENRSADNGKVQIRVAEFFYSSGLRSSSYRPEIVWDNPDNWYLCED